MLWLETKHVRCDCLPQYWHRWRNQKSLCNLMRQGENEVQQWCGNGVTVRLTPGNTRRLCREHCVRGHENSRERGHASNGRRGFSFSLWVMWTERRTHRKNQHLWKLRSTGSAPPLPPGCSFDHSEAAWDFCLICHWGNLKIWASEGSNCSVNWCTDNTRMPAWFTYLPNSFLILFNKQKLWFMTSLQAAARWAGLPALALFSVISDSLIFFIFMSLNDMSLK